MPETEIFAELIEEPEGEVERIALAHPLVSVVITKSGPVQLMPLVRLVAELRRLELSDVAPRISASSGIIIRDATKHEAESIAGELNRQDVPYVLIPTRELPEIEKIEQLFRVRVGSRGMRLRLVDGKHVDAKWNNILTVTCVRIQAPSDSGGETPARLILSIFTREPFVCYQLSENIPGGRIKTSSTPYEPTTRFERLGRTIYESFTRSAQNKGMRVLSNYGLRGKWKGLTFDRMDEVNSYNFWVALLRKHLLDLRGAIKPKFSVPWLRRIEFEQEARANMINARYHIRTHQAPPPVPSKPPIIVSPPTTEWMPVVTRQVGIQSVWLNFATVFAAICLAVYIILELLG